MSTKLASLYIDLQANSAKFARELGRAERQTRAWRRKVVRDVKVVSQRFVALGTAAGAGLAFLTRNSMKSIDALAKTADKLGTTTEGLAGLRFAAEQTGVKIATMDMAIQRMTRRMAEAAKGTGEAKAAIKELGLDAVALSAAGPEEAMRAIADALQNVENKSDRLRLAFKLFDSEGVAVVNTLARGREGLDAFRAQADALGITLNRVDAKKVELANDSMNRAKKVVEGLGNALAVNLSPFIEAIGEKMLAAGTAAGGFHELVGRALLGTAPFFQFVADAILGIGFAWDAVSLQFKAFYRGVLQLTANTKREIADIRSLLAMGLTRGRAQRYTADTSDIDAKIKALDRSTRETLADMSDRFRDRITGSATPILDAMKATISDLDARAADLSKNRGGTVNTDGGPVGVDDKALARMKSLAASIRSSLETPMDAFIRKTKEARALLNNDPPLIDQATFEKYKATLLDGLVEPIGELPDKANKMAERMKAISEQAAGNMQNAFADFLFDPFDKGLKGMLKSFIDTIRRMLANQTATRFFDFLSNSAGGGGGGFFAGIGKLLGFAHGGSFQVGGSGGTDSQIVAFRASPDETVTITPPGMNRVQGGRGAVINITNNIEVTGETDLVQAMPRILDQNNAAMEAMIFDKMRRGLTPA